MGIVAVFGCSGPCGLERACHFHGASCLPGASPRQASSGEKEEEPDVVGVGRWWVVASNANLSGPNSAKFANCSPMLAKLSPIWVKLVHLHSESGQHCFHLLRAPRAPRLRRWARRQRAHRVRRFAQKRVLRAWVGPKLGDIVADLLQGPPDRLGTVKIGSRTNTGAHGPKLGPNLSARGADPGDLRALLFGCRAATRRLSVDLSGRPRELPPPTVVPSPQATGAEIAPIGAVKMLTDSSSRAVAATMFCNASAAVCARPRRRAAVRITAVRMRCKGAGICLQSQWVGRQPLRCLTSSAVDTRRLAHTQVLSDA